MCPDTVFDNKTRDKSLKIRQPTNISCFDLKNLEK